MKHLLFTMLFFLGTALLVQAQVEIKPAIGMNFSRLTDEPENFSQSARVGYQFGGTVKIGKKLYLEPGALWTKLSSEMVHAHESDFNLKTDINAFRVPVFVGYQIIGGEEEDFFGLRIIGGPSFSWITAVKNNDEKLKKDDFSNVQWGTDLGAGVDLWFMYLDLGYEWGLNNVFKDVLSESKNRAFWFNIGARIKM